MRVEAARTNILKDKEISVKKLNLRLLVVAVAAYFICNLHANITIQNKSKFEIKVSALVYKPSSGKFLGGKQGISLPSNSVTYYRGQGSVLHPGKKNQGPTYTLNSWVPGILPGETKQTTEDGNMSRTEWLVWAKIGGKWSHEQYLAGGDLDVGGNIKAVIDSTMNNKGEPVFSIKIESI